MNSARNKWDTLSAEDSVQHIKYGTGRVVSIKDGLVTVRFRSRQSMFRFPDSFEKGFLSLVESEPGTIAPKQPTVDIEQEAKSLYEKYPTNAEFESHYKENVAQYGVATYRQISLIVKRLIQEEKDKRERFFPERAYSQDEKYWLNVAMMAIFRLTEGQVRTIAAEMKGRYHSLAGILAACYPNQGENGRPAKKKKNPDTGKQEWRSYKRITYDSLLNLFEICYNNYISYKSSKQKPIVDVHYEGEPVVRALFDNSMKTDRMASIQVCLEQLQDCQTDLEMVRDDEQDAYDNLPEGLQDSERGDIMSENVDTLEEAIGSLEDAVSYLQEITDSSDEDLIMEKSPWDDLKIGDTLMHKSFGEGTISSISDGFIIVSLDSREARFRFPDAFEKEQLIIGAQNI